MEPTWGPSGADRTQVGPILAPWTWLSGLISPSPASSAYKRLFQAVLFSWKRQNIHILSKFNEKHFYKYWMCIYCHGIWKIQEQPGNWKMSNNLWIVSWISSERWYNEAIWHFKAPAPCCLFNSLLRFATNKNTKALHYGHCVRGFPKQAISYYTSCFNKVERGYTGFTLSVCPSVRLWTELCPLCILNNTRQIHFIFEPLIKQLQKVCYMYGLLKN